MLRITASHHGDRLSLKPEGRLVGNWADELRETVVRTLQADSPRIEVDLTDVTFVDSKGEQTLRFLQQLGVSFIGCNGFCKEVFREFKRRRSTLSNVGAF